MPKRRLYLSFVHKLLLLITLSSSAPHLQALTCQNIKEINSYYLQSHYSVHTFDREISRRTLDNFIKAWDPGKVYFTKVDVDEFVKKYEARLATQINRSDCSFIEAIFSRYTKRFEERQALIPSLINSKHDFKLDEFLDLNRKSMKWALNKKSTDERWRKRVKFQHMQLFEALSDEAIANKEEAATKAEAADKVKTKIKKLKKKSSTNKQMAATEQTKKISLSKKEKADIHLKVREKLHKRYKLLFKRHRELDTNDVYEVYLDAFARSLDPHTSHYSPTLLEDFHIATRLSLEGIGALLRSEDGFTKIQSLIPGGAAFKTKKIEVEDIIIAVAQGTGTPVNIIDMDLRDVVKLVRGPGGTEVRLTVKRKAKTFVIPIIREKIQLQDKAAKSETHKIIATGKKQKNTHKIGVIDLPSFYMDLEARQARKKDYKSSSQDVKKEVIKLMAQNVEAIVLDLRSNGGGILDEAINIAGLFAGPGPMVQQKGSKTKAFANYYRQSAIYTGPLVILIGRQSASASEILAGAIQDYNRGLIVGASHTFGKGTVQHLNDLDPKLGAIKVTINKFYLPDGSSTQLKGVPSDITFPSIIEHYEVGEKYYDYALSWDKVDTAPHHNFKQTSKKIISTLTQASTNRIKKDDDFKKVFKAIEKYKSNKEKRFQVSLNMFEKKDKDEEDEDDELEKSQILADIEDETKSSLKYDIYLREAVFVATDYARMLANKKLLHLETDIKKITAKKDTTVHKMIKKSNKP